MSADNVVYFAHGKESGPWGEKITRMAAIAREQGWAVESPDYSFTMDPDERVAKLLSLKPSAKKHLVLVGSSMGGYVSTVGSQELRPSGLFLLAPAFFRTGYAQKEPVPHAPLTIIVHGWQDELIPAQNSIDFAAKHKTELYLINSDHRLMSALDVIEQLFGRFLSRVSELKGNLSA